MTGTTVHKIFHCMLWKMSNLIFFFNSSTWIEIDWQSAVRTTIYIIFYLQQE